MKLIEASAKKTWATIALSLLYLLLMVVVYGIAESLPHIIESTG